MSVLKLYPLLNSVSFFKSLHTATTGKNDLKAPVATDDGDQDSKRQRTTPRSIRKEMYVPKPHPHVSDYFYIRIFVQKLYFY